MSTLGGADQPLTSSRAGSNLQSPGAALGRLSAVRYPQGVVRRRISDEAPSTVPIQRPQSFRIIHLGLDRDPVKTGELAATSPAPEPIDT